MDIRYKRTKIIETVNIEGNKSTKEDKLLRIGDSEKGERRTEKGRVSPGIEKLKKIFECEVEESRETTKKETKVKQLKSAFELMMTKSCEKKKEKEKLVKRKLIKKKKDPDICKGAIDKYTKVKEVELASASTKRGEGGGSKIAEYEKESENEKVRKG